jgi:hypothetical protein
MEPAHKSQLVRRYRMMVTLALIVLCNAVFLLGIRLSGVNLDALVKTPEEFDPIKDICLRLTWRRVAGEKEPIRLCSEWINLSDPSGKTHLLQNETEVVRGADGRFYFKHGPQVDYRLLLFGAFVIAILIFGMLIRRYLIRRYETRLDAAEGHI